MIDDRQTTRLNDAARKAARRAEQLEKDPEASLGRRFGRIGVLGWMIVVPVMFSVVVGGWPGRVLGTGIALSAALTTLAHPSWVMIPRNIV